MEVIKLPQTGTVPAILRKVPQKETIVKFLPILAILLIVIAGILSGLIFSSRNKAIKQASQGFSTEELSGEQKQSFNQTFRDEAEGVVDKNDKLDKYAQGTHKLIRPGGESQTAYLTSSVLDLDVYVGKKVKVYGETFGSAQVGWLMDVGKVDVL